MSTLIDILPAVKSTTSTAHYDHANSPWFKERYLSNPEPAHAAVIAHAKAKIIPPYLNRHGFVPRKPEDFGDGGAFPEIPVAQYPLGMGRKDGQAKLGSKILPLTVDAQGNVAFDAIVRQNENASKIVYASHIDLVPKVLKAGGHEPEQSDEELQKEIEETTQSTKAALEKIVNDNLSAAQPKNAVASQSSDTQLIQYTPSGQSAAFNSGAKKRLVKLANIQRVPLEPPKFRHKKVPRGSGSPPVPVMHSPPRQLTVKDYQDFKIPPCISNWKNPKGYTIPLDKRLAADGRGLQEVQINDNFAKLAEALYVAEEKARESVAMRSKVHKEMLLKEQQRKELELRALAQKARSERKIGGAPPPLSVSLPTPDRIMSDRGEDIKENDRESREEREERLKREKIREERKRERERERRLEAKDAATGKKSKITRDRDRDVSEKVALGMANTGAATRGGEIMYDQRLFNQDKGMDSGFATDDQYNLYDKKLFTAQNTISTLYKPRKDTDSEMYGGADEQLEEVMKTDRFKPDKAFTGVPERAGPRDRPIEFDEPSEKDDDPFGLNRILEVQGGRKKPLDKVGSGGTMRASGGGSSRDDYNGGSGQCRTRIRFEKGGR
ncbi:SNW/SKI-interacting protein A-like [Papaver somniferum]|uniref:SNW/SKI-interacting protein A-like n=1 Tax=Papaver somniferum TaxID=3469 RepID=UPI000E7029E5|nr:SNW/SKI-interacting protein A-like [Papaver somniferum]